MSTSVIVEFRTRRRAEVSGERHSMLSRPVLATLAPKSMIEADQTIDVHVLLVFVRKGNQTQPSSLSSRQLLDYATVAILAASFVRSQLEGITRATDTSGPCAEPLSCHVYRITYPPTEYFRYLEFCESTGNMCAREDSAVTASRTSTNLLYSGLLYWYCSSCCLMPSMSSIAFWLNDTSVISAFSPEV